LGWQVRSGPIPKMSGSRMQSEDGGHAARQAGSSIIAGETKDTLNSINTVPVAISHSGRVPIRFSRQHPKRASIMSRTSARRLLDKAPRLVRTAIVNFPHQSLQRLNITNTKVTRAPLCLADQINRECGAWNSLD
jgi:hypothetical protein